MATTVSSLLTQLQERLGITSPPTAVTNQLTRAIYVAITRAAQKGIPGLAAAHVTGETFAPSSFTVSSHTAGTSIVTPNALPTHARPGDVLEIGSKYYTVYDISGSDYDIGAPVQVSLAAASGTHYPNSVALPHTGPVKSVFSLDRRKSLDHMPNGYRETGFQPGTPRGYEVAYDRDNETALVTFWPPPDRAHRVVIDQDFAWDTVSTSTSLPFPDAALDALLEDATMFYRSWRTGGISPMEMEAGRQAQKATGQSLDGTSHQPITRDPLNHRGRVR